MTLLKSAGFSHPLPQICDKYKQQRGTDTLSSAFTHKLCYKSLLQQIRAMCSINFRQIPLFQKFRCRVEICGIFMPMWEERGEDRMKKERGRKKYHRREGHKYGLLWSHLMLRVKREVWGKILFGLAREEWMRENNEWMREGRKERKERKVKSRQRQRTEN